MTRPLAPVRLSERAIPVPETISQQAQAALSAAAQSVALPYPDAADSSGWPAWAAMANEQMAAMNFGAKFRDLVDSEATLLGGVPTFRLWQKNLASQHRRNILLDLHGGAFIAGGGEICRAMAVDTAGTMNATVYAPDYRQLPLYPYPAPLDDCMAVYRALLDTHEPGNIVVQGSSAGGNLAAALVLRARDAGLPLPAGLILKSPEVDLTESGDSFQTNRDIDVMLKRSLRPINDLYANGRDPRDPLLSPLFGDFTHGFPRTIITTGTRDMFLSNAVRLNNAFRRANVAVELRIFEAMPHGGFLGAPEDEELAQDVARFAEHCWRKAG